MTWIKTVRMDDDERVKKAMEAQRKLYPVEYATPVNVVVGTGFAHLASRRVVPRLQHFRRVDVARSSLKARSARNDRHHGVGDQPLSLLNRISRRVSASRNARRKNGRGAAKGLQDRAHQRAGPRHARLRREVN